VDYPYNSCEEAIKFVDLQFDRFQAPKPSAKSVDKIVDYVTKYVTDNNYYPLNPNDAITRFTYPGLTEPERFSITGKLEYELKMEIDRAITHDQIHLAAWAALMFCWSEEGEEHLSWYKTIAEEGNREFQKIMLQANA
jgi:glycosidase